MVMTLWAQRSAVVDYLASAGRCETDYNRDGREDFLFFSSYPSIAAEHVTLALDMQTKFEGTASQRIELRKPDGEPARYVIHTIINFNAHLKPAVGEPILVRFTIRAQNLQNARYGAYVVTGRRRVNLFSGRTFATNDWEQHSMIIPVEQAEDGSPSFRFNIELEAGSGAAQAVLWLDAIQAISTRTVISSGRLPNSLKLCLDYLYLNNDGYRFLELPIGIVVGAKESERVLSRHYPNLLCVPYAYFSGTMYPSTYRYNADLYNYDDVVQNHPEWFLLDRDGQRIPLDETYYIDIGLPEVRERAPVTARFSQSSTPTPVCVLR